MGDNLIKLLSFCDGHASTVAACADNGDGDASAGHVRYELLFFWNGRAREADDHIVTRAFREGASGAGEAHEQELTDRSVEDVLLDDKVGEEQDFAAGSEGVACGEVAVLGAAVGGLV